MKDRRRESPTKRVNPSGREVWVARYTNRDGKRVSAGTYRLRRDAQDAIEAAYERMESGPRRGVMTIREYARTWTARHPRSQRTNDTNEHRLKAMIGPFTDEHLRREAEDRLPGRKHRSRPGIVVEGRPLGDWPLDEVKRFHIREVLDALLTDQGRSANGATGVLSTLSAMYNDALDDERCEVNPCRGVRIKASDPRAQKESHERIVVSWEDMHRLCAAAGEREAMLRLLSDCGLRLGELLGLDSSDVKLGGCAEDGCLVRGPHLHVRRTAHAGRVEMGTKRERLRGRLEGGRVVPLPEATFNLLRALPPRIAGPMWTDPRGRTQSKTYTEQSFWRYVWKRARDEAGVSASPQDFRHSWVSHLRAARVDPADLAQMAGHSLEVATMTYTHALGQSYDDVRRAVGE